MSSQSTNVIDRQTDRWTDGQLTMTILRYTMLLRVKIGRPEVGE